MLGSAAEIAATSDYGKAKREQLRVGLEVARDRGIALLPVRLFNTIGPGQSRHLVVGAMVERLNECIRHGIEVIEVRDPFAVRDYLDVRDVARCLVELASEDSAWTSRREPLELCSGEGTSVAGLVGELLAVAAATQSVRFLPGPGDHWVGNPRELESVMGDRPIKTISTFRSIGDMWSTSLREAA